jgi:DNA-binding protein HU-beta
MKTKDDLVKQYSTDVGVTAKQGKQHVGAFFTAMQSLIAEGGGLAIQGFGTFTVVIRKARQGRNPKTGEAVAIPEKRILKFKPSSGFKLEAPVLSQAPPPEVVVPAEPPAEPPSFEAVEASRSHEKIHDKKAQLKPSPKPAKRIRVPGGVR